jgi:DNA-binding transcriptional LysR family regulator
VELRHLRYLVAVAAERHFGRAAQRLYISQPSLSYAIANLERELGVQLLHRNSREVIPTEAGQEILALARQTVAAADRVTVAAEQHRTGHAGLLRIGFEATGGGPLQTAARQHFTDTYPDVRVELRRFDWGAEADALRNGDVDAAFVWLPCDDTDLHLEIVATEPRHLGVRVDHPLAERTGVFIDQTAGIPLMTTGLAPDWWRDWWAVNPRPDGTQVTWGPDNNNVEECFEHVAAGDAAAICPTSIIDFYRRPDIAWVPITDIDPLRIAIARRATDDTPIVAAFLDVVCDLAATPDHESTNPIPQR